MFGIVILVCITGFFGYASITLLSRNEPAWFILTVFFSIFCYITYNAIKKFQERKKRESETQYIDDKYLSIKNSLDIPNTCKEVTYFSSTIDSKLNFGERRVDLLCWKVDGDLCFFPSSPSDKNQVKIDEMNVISIPISEIE